MIIAPATPSASGVIPGVVEGVVDAPVNIGGSLTGLVVSPDNSTVYVVAGNELLYYDVAAKAVTGRAAFPAGKWITGGVAVSPDNKTAYVSAGRFLDILAIDLGSKSAAHFATTTNQVIYPAMTADGRTLYLGGSAGVEVFDVASKTPGTPFACANNQGIALSKDGATMYVGEAFVNPADIQVIDTRTGTVKKVLRGGGALKQITGIALNPDESKLYATHLGDGEVSVTDIATDTVVKKITGVNKPFGIAVSPDGKRVFFTVSGTGEIAGII